MKNGRIATSLNYRTVLLVSAILLIMLALAVQPIWCDDSRTTFDAEKVLLRLHKLNTLTVKYRVDVQFSPSEKLLKMDGSKSSDGKSFLIVPKGVVTASGEFWKDETQWRYQLAADSRMTDDSPLGFAEYTISRSVSRVERLTLEPGEGRDYSGGIYTDMPLPEDQYLDVGLGLRMLNASVFWTQRTFVEAIRKAQVINADTLSLSDGQGLRSVLRFANEHQFALSGYDGFALDGKPFVKGSFTEFKFVDGIAIPHRLTWEFLHADGQPYRTYEYDIESCDLSATHEFLVEWPLGASVYDDQSGASIRIKTKAQVLSDDVLRNAIDDFDRRFPQLMNSEASTATPEKPQDWTSFMLVVTNAFVLLVIGIVLFVRRLNRSQSM